MARPLLADPDLVRKAQSGRDEDINTCIACNQACLDHVFSGRRATCLVNPRACYETELPIAHAAAPRNVAVVGAGPAGLSAAVEAAARGHRVTLLEASDRIGGQLNLAVRVPGKQEFHETLRYFQRRLEALAVSVRLSHAATTQELHAYDAVVVATGVTPRRAQFPGCNHERVVGYLDVLTGRCEPGPRVAIVGGGGIGFDVAEVLTHAGENDASDAAEFLRTWAVDRSGLVPGAWSGPLAPLPCARTVYLMQRRKGKPGGRLGKTTGWVLKTRLERRGVQLLGAVSYEGFDDRGLLVSILGQPRLLQVDHVVICAGQLPHDTLSEPLRALGRQVLVIGGASRADELDARRAIREGLEAAMLL